MGVLFDDGTLGAWLRDEYRRLAGPALRYQVVHGNDGKLRWIDGSTQPPCVLDREPDASLPLRAITRVLRWLPIESQL